MPKVLMKNKCILFVSTAQVCELNLEVELAIKDIQHYVINKKKRQFNATNWNEMSF